MHDLESASLLRKNQVHNQFSLRSIAVLTAAIALWIWYFREATPVEIAVFSGCALVAGITGHLVYRYLLPWRITVIASVLLIYHSILILLMLIFGGEPDRWRFLYTIAVEPVHLMSYAFAEWNRYSLFVWTLILGMSVFIPAHAIRPSLPTAIITALGIGLWYGTALLMLTYGG